MSQDLFQNVIKFLPERIDIINFKQGNTYTESIEIFNCVDVPLVLKIKSSDSNKINISDSIVKLNPKQSKAILLTIKEDKGIKVINERKRLFLWIKGELVEEKFIIEFHYYNKKDNKMKPLTTQPVVIYEKVDANNFELKGLNKDDKAITVNNNKEEPNKTCQRDDCAKWDYNKFEVKHQEGVIELGRCFNYGLVKTLNEENGKLKETLKRFVNQYQDIKKLLELWAKKAQERIKQFDYLSIEFIETLYLNGNMENTLQYEKDNFLLKIKDIEMENKVLLIENNTLKLHMKVIGNKAINNTDDKNSIEEKAKQPPVPVINFQVQNPNDSVKQNNTNREEDYLSNLEFDYSKNRTIEDQESLIH